MIDVRKSEARGHANHGWLDTHYSFSFANYYDPRNMNFGPLRVINEDRVAPGGGFPTHPHRDMEIITYVLEGALEHKDSMGNGATLYPGEVQRISAASGIMHSEFNPSTTEPVHLMQIWIMPESTGGKPGYDQRNYPDTVRRGRLCPVASHDGHDNSIPIRQDVTLYVTKLIDGESVAHRLSAGRSAWLQIARGSATLNGVPLGPGDAAAIDHETELAITATGDLDALLFDLP